MIIHNDQAGFDFQRYGIDIPKVRDRAAQTVAALLDIPELAARRDDWLDDDPFPPLSPEDLLPVHSRAYVERLTTDPGPALAATYELDRPGRYDPERAELPLSGLVEAALQNAAGSVKAVRTALSNETHFAFNLGGGMHHAMHDAGRGFCPINDIVIAAKAAQREGLAKTVWIVDVDAHRGDGTAELTLGDPTIATLSIHMGQGWPLDDAPLDANGRLTRWRYPGTVDLPVYPGREDDYLPALELGLNLLPRIGPFQRPDLAIVVDGSDPYELDELESAKSLRLTAEQMLERDMLVFQTLRGLDAPQAWLMSGGYGQSVHHVYINFLSRVLPLLLSK